jgi:hypothetical protein
MVTPLGQIGGPGAPLSATITDPSQITPYRSAYTSAKTTFDAALAAYTSAKTDLDAKRQAALNLPADATDAEVQAALDALQVSLDTYNTKKSQYTSASTAFDTAATALINAEIIYQSYIDNTTYTELNNKVVQLHSSKAISDELYTDIVDANTRRKAARNALNLLLNSFRNNEQSIKDSQLNNLLELGAQSADEANAILTTADRSQWPSKVQDAHDSHMVAISNYQGAISLGETVRSSIKDALDTATTAFDNSFNNPLTDTAPGLTPLLEKAIEEGATELAAFNTAVQNALTFALQQIEDLYNLSQTNDETARQAHNAQYPTESAEVGQEIGAVQSEIDTTITQRLQGAEYLEGIDWPELPPLGKELSMNDIFRIFSALSTLSDRFAKYLSKKDYSITQARSLIQQLIYSRLSEELAIRFAAAYKIAEADAKYMDDVEIANKTAQKNAEKDHDAINDNKDDINDAIDAINTENTGKSEDLKTLVDALNMSAQNSVKLLNEAKKGPPEAINVLDELGVYADQDLPIEAPIPSTTDYLSDYTEIPQIPSLPDVPNRDTATQAEIDAYNAAIAVINGILGPIEDKVNAYLATLHPPEKLPDLPLQPLYYREKIEVRTLDTLIDQEAYDAVVASIKQMLYQNMLNSTSLEEFATDMLSTKKLKQQDLQAPAAVQQDTTSPATAAGVGWAAAPGAAGEKKPSLLSALLNSQLFQDTLRDNIERATIFGLAGAVRPPQRATEYSIFGILQKQMADETKRVIVTRSQVDRETQAFITIGDQLVRQSKDTGYLRANALRIIANDPRIQGMKDKDVRELIGQVVRAQQFSMLSMAAVSYASAGANGSSAVAAANLATIFATPNLQLLDIENLRKLEKTTPENKREALKLEVLSALQAIGFSSATIEAVRTAKTPLSVAVMGALKRAPQEFIAGLNINLAALPAETRAKLEAQAENLLGGLTFLSSSEKASLAIALGTGVFSKAQATEVADILNTIKKTGEVTPEAAAKLMSLRPQTIASSKFELLKEASKKLATDTAQEDFAKRRVEEHAKSLIDDKNNYEYTIDMIMAPRRTGVKISNIRTAEPTKPGQKPPTATFLG